MLNGLDLFSGIGGIAVALREWARPVAYCEIDRYCQGVLLSRMSKGDIGKAPIWDNVSTLNKTNLGEITDLFNERSDMAGTLKKLTPEQVSEAVAFYGSGSSLADLAHVYSVSRQSMHDLLKRRISLRPNLRFGAENHFYRGGRRADKQAHDKMEKAIGRGELVNPGKCSDCGGMGTFADGRNSIQGITTIIISPSSCVGSANNAITNGIDTMPQSQGRREMEASPSILFTGASRSRARTLALRELELAWQESAPAWSSRSFASSTKSGRALSSWKTSQPLGPVEANEWLKNWPGAGMTVDGTCYPLTTWGHRTFVKGGSYLLPTPSARDWKDWNYNKGFHGTQSPQIPVWLYQNYGVLPTVALYECIMSYPDQCTVLEPWAMQWYQAKHGKHSKD